MAKKSKQNPKSDTLLLELLKTVLPKAVSDPKLAQKILTACEMEIKAKNRVVSFDKFCQTCKLPDLKPETVAGVQAELEQSFGKGKVSLVPHPQKKAVSVEVVLQDETFEGVIRIKSPEEGDGEPEDEIKPRMTPFPVALPGDPELIWMLARPENRSPDEAAIALTQVQDEFWESKTGQKLLRDRVERSFPEFISRAPAKMLSEVGLKRHYKEPEPVKQLKVLKPVKHRNTESVRP